MADSGSTTTNLTREQKEFLDECLVEFANRFTDEDPEYKKAYDRDVTKPPIITPWYGRPRHPAARSGGQRNYQGRYDRDRYENREPRYDRHRDREDGYSQQRYRPY